MSDGECSKSGWPYYRGDHIGSEQKCPDCGRWVRIITGLFGAAYARHTPPVRRSL